MTEEGIAGLDGDWAEFSPARRAAFAFARKISFEPHRIADADIDDLRKHYTELQILEMIMSIAGNNSINRWKEGIGIPQEREASRFTAKAEKPAAPGRVLPIKSFLTPTPEKYRDLVSKVAPLDIDEKTGQATHRTIARRPKLESRVEAEKALALAEKRSPRLPLLTEEKAREVLGKDWTDKAPLPQWVRLLANFPRDGKARILSGRSVEAKGDLTPLLKAQVSWIIARQDRAWYAAGEAKRRLKDLGQKDDQIYALDGDWSSFTTAEWTAFRLASKLAASPIVLTDTDVADALKHRSPKEVVQLINYVTNRASFDRITEAAGLKVEK